MHTDPSIHRKRGVENITKVLIDQDLIYRSIVFWMTYLTAPLHWKSQVGSHQQDGCQWSGFHPASLLLLYPHLAFGQWSSPQGRLGGGNRRGTESSLSFYLLLCHWLWNKFTEVLGASPFYTKSDSLSHEIYFFKMAPQLEVLKQFNIPMGASWMQNASQWFRVKIWLLSEINMQ